MENKAMPNTRNYVSIYYLKKQVILPIDMKGYKEKE